jgi:hypothetical protein
MTPQGKTAVPKSCGCGTARLTLLKACRLNELWHFQGLLERRKIDRDPVRPKSEVPAAPIPAPNLIQSLLGTFQEADSKGAIPRW